jgi:hypothetical protein
MAIDSTMVRSRRSLLTATLAGLAGAVAATAASAQGVLAAGDDGKIIHVGDSWTEVHTDTLLQSTDAASVLTVWNSKTNGIGLHGIAPWGRGVHGNTNSGTAIYADSNSGTGVYAEATSGTAVNGTSSSGVGVYGQSDKDDAVYGYSSVSGCAVHGYAAGAPAMRGESADSSSPAIIGHSLNGSTGVLGVSGGANEPAPPNKTGVYGQANQGGSVGVFGKSGPGIGVQGISSSSYGVYGQSDTSYAVYGYNDSSGTAILGYGQNGEGVRGHTTSSATPAVIGHSFTDTTGVVGFSGGATEPSIPKKTGVLGVANQDAVSVGVRGGSPTGRGGVFSGKLAQLRLAPSTDAAHPASGQRGDLFVDKDGRLWFCKGTTHWKQIA